MGFLGSVILREGTDVPAVLLRALLGQEPKGSVAWGLEFTVRHGLVFVFIRFGWVVADGGRDKIRFLKKKCAGGRKSRLPTEA